MRCRLMHTWLGHSSVILNPYCIIHIERTRRLRTLKVRRFSKFLTTMRQIHWCWRCHKSQRIISPSRLSFNKSHAFIINGAGYVFDKKHSTWLLAISQLCGCPPVSPYNPSCTIIVVAILQLQWQDGDGTLSSSWETNNVADAKWGIVDRRAEFLPPIEYSDVCRGGRFVAATIRTRHTSSWGCCGCASTSLLSTFQSEWYTYDYGRAKRRAAVLPGWYPGHVTKIYMDTSSVHQKLTKLGLSWATMTVIK